MMGVGKTPEIEKLRRARLSAAGLGRKPTDEARANMRAGHLRRDPERERIRRAAISAFNLGRKRSAEQCARIGAENRSRELGKGRGRLPGYKASAETIEKKLASKWWLHLTLEAKTRIRAANKSKVGRPLSAEHKAKIGAAGRGRVDSPETKQRKREAQRRPEVLAKMSLARSAQSRLRQPTQIELAVRDALTAAGVEFVFQYPIGRYVADFFLPLPGKNLILECDGDYLHSLPGVKEKDASRDAYITARGYRVIRLPEHRIKKGVVPLLEEMVS
jgi:very-short-patch-repair endonuclease